MTATIVETLDEAPIRPRRMRSGLNRAASRSGLGLAILIIVVVVAWAVAPGLFTHWDPYQPDPSYRLKGPSVRHWFGTDLLGRDLFSRTVHGAINSLSGGLIAVTVGLVAGAVLGLLAGYYRGWVDVVIMRLVDVLLAIPGLMLAMSIVAAFGFSTRHAAIAVGVGSVSAFARLMRSEVLRVRGTDFVEAAVGSGVGSGAIIVRHLLPNSLRPVLALGALQFGMAILAIATLGYLGFGTPPPTPEWGLLIADGRNYMAVAWWLTVLPGLVLLAVVLSAGRISAQLRERL